MKTLSFVLIALVGTMILGIPVQSYADPQLDTLLTIATQARDHLSITISQINNIPNEITNLYNQGSSETDELAKAVDQQDVNLAKQHFLSAMQFFKATNDKINSLNATVSTDQQSTDIIQMQSEITRMDNLGKRLQTIAVTNHVDIDFAKLDQFIQAARQDLDSGNTNDASKAIQNANQFLTDAHHSLATIAAQRTSDRAKDFTQKEIERFNQTIPNTVQNVFPVTPLPVSPIQNNTNTTQQENPQEMLAKLRILISQGKVDEAIKVIKSLQAYQKERIQTRANAEGPSAAVSGNVSSTISGNTAETNSTVANSSTVTNETLTNSTAMKLTNKTSINPALSNSTNASANSTKIGNETVTKKNDVAPATSSGKVGSGQEDNTKKNHDKKHARINSKKIKHTESD